MIIEPSENPNLEAIDSEFQVDNQPLEQSEDTLKDEQGNLAPNSSSENEDGKTETTKQEENPTEESTVEKTEQEIEAEEEAKRIENNKKAEAGKIAQLERERNQFSQELKTVKEASSITSRIKDSNPEKVQSALIELASDPAKYDRLLPHLEQDLPQLAGVDYQTFKAEYEAFIAQQAQVDPVTAKSQQQYQAKLRENEFNQEMENLKMVEKFKFEVFQAVPEFYGLYQTQPDLAESDFADALNVASVQYNRQKRLGGNPDMKAITLKAIHDLHPEFQQNKQAVNATKKAMVNDLETALKGASTTSSPTTSKADLDVSKLSAQRQVAFSKRLDTYLERGIAEDQAKKMAWNFVNEL